MCSSLADTAPHDYSKRYLPQNNSSDCLTDARRMIPSARGLVSLLQTRCSFARLYLPLNILSPLCLVSFFFETYVCAVFPLFKPCTHAGSIHRPPCAGFLHFLISILLPLTPLHHGQIFAVFSCRLSLLLSAFLSVSLFGDCSGWSPCGAPCRVPNLFIISALCQDARGMLKYTPPHSGYKWAAVSRAVFQLTRPQGRMALPNTNTGLTFPVKGVRAPQCIKPSRVWTRTPFRFVS